MSWEMPNAEEMDKIEGSIPVRIPDLSEGKFRGLIEETETEIDEQGHENESMFNLNIRVLATGNEDHIGKLMAYSHYLKNKKGRWIPKSYHWLSALCPAIAEGKGFHPMDLQLIEFEADVVYNGKYWNLTNPRFVQKHPGFDL